MQEEYKQFVKDEGQEMEKEGCVSFTTKKAADDYVENATRRGFAVAVVRSEEAGREFFNVHYTGDLMNDDELIAEFMRIRSEGDATLLEVALVKWRGPDEPSLRWQRFHTWAGIPTTTEVEAAQRQALDDPSLFQHCDRCGERCNRGHMHNDHICQSCAERFLGVVY
jgi:hypothetical protein